MCGIAIHCEGIEGPRRAWLAGALVAVHSLMRFHPAHPGVAVVHVFRFEGDKIAEFWDVAQVLPDESPNKNGPL